MNFKAKGVSRLLAQNTSELIRSELINSQKFYVIERAQVDLILKEQGFQRTGCTDRSCAVEVGKLLSANKALLGTVMKLGSKYVITARIVDIEKGIGEFSDNQGADSSRDIYIAVKNLSANLADGINKSDVEEKNLSSISLEKKIIDKSNIEEKRNENVEIKKINAKKVNNSFVSYVDGEYHNPFYAGVFSLLPFWSGSLNNGFERLGLTLTVIKGFSFIGMALAYSLPSKFRSEGRDVDAKNLEQMALPLLCAWAGLTLIDVIYSFTDIHQHNPIMPSRKKSLSGDIALSVTPRVFNSIDKNSVTFACDGINMKISMRFN